jgi:hypothetical protein
MQTTGNRLATVRGRAGWAWNAFFFTAPLALRLLMSRLPPAPFRS